MELVVAPPSISSNGSSICTSPKASTTACFLSVSTPADTVGMQLRLLDRASVTKRMMTSSVQRPRGCLDDGVVMLLFPHNKNPVHILAGGIGHAVFQSGSPYGLDPHIRASCGIAPACYGICTSRAYIQWSFHY